jgi:glutathione S-transferase
MALPHLHLVSFPLCPFVQRSVILLKHKNVPFELTLLNPQELPDWFLEKSPTGKVPLLLVNQDTAVFESAVISEYVDEITPPRLLPADPLQRALDRAWIAFVSDLVMAVHRWMTASTEEAFRAARDEAAKSLKRLEAQCKAAPCFTGPDLSLLDAALAPALMRLDLLQDPESPWQPDDYPTLAGWWRHMSGLPEVKDSTVQDFRERLIRFLNAQEGFAGPRLAAGLAARGH